MAGAGGFNIGDPIQVTVSPQRLVIQPKSPAVKSRTELQAERRAALRKTASHNLTEAVAACPSHASTRVSNVTLTGEVSDSSPHQHFGGSSQAAKDRPTSVPYGNLRHLIGTGAHGRPDRRSAQVGLRRCLVAERSRLQLHPARIAAHAGVSDSQYRAFDRGDNQPNLATFIAIAWVLDQDPRELFDKLLLQMGFPPGNRPVITPRRG